MPNGSFEPFRRFSGSEMRIDVGDRVYVIETPPPREPRRLRWPGLRRTVSHVLFGGCVLAVIALVVANVLAWRGDLPGLETTQPASISRVPAGETAQPTPSAAGPELARLTIDATQGPCFVVVRENGPSGDVLFRGLLEQGQQVEVAEPRLWIRAGATENVVLELNGEPMKGVSSGAVELIVTPQGVEPDAAS
jgi:hypothetical protein